MSEDYSYNFNSIFFTNENVFFQNQEYKIESIEIEEINNINRYKITTEDNNIFFFINNLLSNINDEPAIILGEGSEFWYKDGLLHRENSYAINWSFNEKSYYLNGVKKSKLDFFTHIVHKKIDFF